MIDRESWLKGLNDMIDFCTQIILGVIVTVVTGLLTV